MADFLALSQRSCKFTRFLISVIEQLSKLEQILGEDWREEFSRVYMINFKLYDKLNDK